MKKLIFLVPLFFFSFESFGQKNIFNTKVSDSERTITFESNIKDVRVRFKNNSNNYNEIIGVINGNELSYIFSEIYPSQLYIEFYGDHVETQVLKISRVLKNYFNPFSPKSYIISKKFRTNFIEMEYKDEFMKKKYEEIVNSQDSKDFENYISTFSKSKQKNLAINKRDSLELSYAIALKSEKAIETYISKFQSSKFISDAIKIKKEFEDARLAFNIVKQKPSITGLESFIGNYPNSIHLNDAYFLLINSAELAAKEKNTSDAFLNYYVNYLSKFSNYLNKQDLDVKQKSFEENIDKLIILENVDEKNIYNSYSKLWKRYQEVKLIIKTDLEQIEGFIPKISNLLLSELSKHKDKSTQVSLLNKYEIDYPEIYNSYYEKLIYFLIDRAEGFTGSLVLYDQKYFKNRIEKYGERDISKGLEGFNYKGEYFTNYKESSIEEIVLENGEFKIIKLFNEREPLAIWTFNSKESYERSFYIDGKLVVIEYRNGKNYYTYEFENGINLSLKNLDYKIDDAINASKANDFDRAFEILNKECKNDFPKNVKENIRLENTLVLLKQEKEAYLKKQEEIRIEEQRKREEQRLAEEKKLTEYLYQLYFGSNNQSSNVRESCTCEWCSSNISGKGYEYKRHGGDPCVPQTSAMYLANLCAPYCSRKCAIEACRNK